MSWHFDVSQTDTTNWQPFDKEATETIEAAFLRGDPTVSLKIGFTNKPGCHFYTVDFKTMTQVNQATEKQRKICRIVPREDNQ